MHVRWSSILTLAFIPLQFMQTNAAQLKGSTILRLSETLGKNLYIVEMMNSWQYWWPRRRMEARFRFRSYRRLLFDREGFSIDWANARIILISENIEELQQDLRFRKKKNENGQFQFICQSSWKDKVYPKASVIGKCTKDASLAT